MTMTAGLIEDLRQQLAAAEAENERLCRVYAGICVTIVQAGIPAFGTAEEGVQKLAAERDRAVKDAERYRWLRTAGAWESELGMDDLSANPDKFDAAVDATMKRSP